MSSLAATALSHDADNSDDRKIDLDSGDDIYTFYFVMTLRRMRLQSSSECPHMKTRRPSTHVGPIGRQQKYVNATKVRYMDMWTLSFEW